VTQQSAGPTKVRVSEALWPDDRAVVEELFREYVAALGVDVSFQNVEEEFASLPGRYARPLGCVLIARAGSDAVGVVARRMLEPGLCEMKRLYIRPQFRGRGIAHKLTEAMIADAHGAGYKTMVLDTLASMQAARSLYAGLGFRPVPAYYDNPLPNVVYLGLDLGRSATEGRS
jgi:ribosomal protein S18 acetylase RimI-like enzyme